MNRPSIAYLLFIFCLFLSERTFAQTDNIIEQVPLHSDNVPSGNYKNIDSINLETCQILLGHLEAGTLGAIIVQSETIDLDGDGIVEKLIPTAKKESGVSVGYDIISQGDDGPISSGFGFKDALSILFLNVENINYIWIEAASDISSLHRLSAKIDNMWDMETICRFRREDKP